MLKYRANAGWPPMIQLHGIPCPGTSLPLLANGSGRIQHMAHRLSTNYMHAPPRPCKCHVILGMTTYVWMQYHGSDINGTLERAIVKIL